jgi:hypothetical protein
VRVEVLHAVLGEQRGVLVLEFSADVEVFEIDDERGVDRQPGATDAAVGAPSRSDDRRWWIRAEEVAVVGAGLGVRSQILQCLCEGRDTVAGEVERPEASMGRKDAARVVEPSLPGEDVLWRELERVGVPADPVPIAVQCPARTNAWASGAMRAISSGVCASRSTVAGARLSRELLAPKNQPWTA